MKLTIFFIAVICATSARGFRPSFPSIPTPSLSAPSIPDVRKSIPSIPSLNVPDLPTSIPSPNTLREALPEVPSVPHLPSSLPSVPSDISLPDLPSSMPSIPSIPLSKMTGKEGPCSIEGTGAKCCRRKAITSGYGLEVCVKLAFNMRDLSLDGTVSVNNREVLKAPIKQVDRVCVNLPQLMGTKVCLGVYHFDASLMNRSMDLCFEVSLSNLVSLQFDCVRMKDGRISFNTENKPEHGSSIINIGVNKGKPTFKFEKPSLPSLPSFFGKK